MKTVGKATLTVIGAGLGAGIWAAADYLYAAQFARCAIGKSSAQLMAGVCPTADKWLTHRFSICTKSTCQPTLLPLLAILGGIGGYAVSRKL